MSMTKIVNEVLKQTVKEKRKLLEIANFEDLFDYIEETYDCSTYETYESFDLIFSSNSGHMFLVHNTLYERYDGIEEVRPQSMNANNTIAEFELLTDKDGDFVGRDGQYSMMLSHIETIKERYAERELNNDTGVYSYREFCGDCGMCIKTVLACPMCGSKR